MDPVPLILGLGGAIAGAWAKVSEVRRRGKRDVSAVQLDAWTKLFNEVHQEAADCRAREQQLREQMSSLRTKVVALEKVMTGEWPPGAILSPGQSERLERSDRPPGAPGGDLSL